MSLKVSLLEKIFKIRSKSDIDFYVNLREKSSGEHNLPYISYHIPVRDNESFIIILLSPNNPLIVQDIRHYDSIYIKPVLSKINFICQGRKDTSEDHKNLYLDPKDYKKTWLLADEQF